MMNQDPNMFLANRTQFEDGPSAIEVLIPSFTRPGGGLLFISEIVETNGPFRYTDHYCCDTAELEKIFKECSVNSIRCLMPEWLSDSGQNEIHELCRLAKASFIYKEEEDYLAYEFDFFDGKRFYYDPEATGEKIDKLKYRTIIDFHGMYIDQQ